MKSSKKQTAIFYVKKDEGILYAKKLSSPLTVQFPKDVVYNLDVISKEKLQLIIQSFIRENTIKPSNIFFILDKNVTFEKDIEEDSIPKQREEIEKFLDIVPFEKILSRVFRVRGNAKVIVANQEFYEELVSAFEEEEFSINAITPFSMLEKIMSTSKKDFDAKIASGKIAMLKQYSLLDVPDNQEKRITYTKPQAKSTQFIFLVSTFAVLLVVLFVLIYTQVFMSSPKTSPISKQVPTVIQQSSQSGSLETTPSK
jgi:hypothetical protein